MKQLSQAMTQSRNARVLAILTANALSTISRLRVRICLLALCVSAVLVVDETISGPQSDTMLAAAGQSAPIPEAVKDAVKQLRNADVDWVIFPTGEISPITTGAAVATVLENPEAAVPELMSALERPESFAIAHVLLCQIYNRSGACFSRTNEGIEVLLYYLRVLVSFKTAPFPSKVTQYPDPEEQTRFLRSLWEPPFNPRLRQPKGGRKRPEPTAIFNKVELDKARQALREGAKGDITWQFGWAGILAVVPPALRTYAIRNMTVELLNALEDPERDILAHVLLTEIHRQQARGTIREDGHRRVIYNNLTVTMENKFEVSAAGVQYPNIQLERHWIRHMWREILSDSLDAKQQSP